MAKSQGRAGLIITIILLALTVLAVGGVALWQNLQSKQTTETSSEATDTPAKTDTKTEEEKTPKPETPVSTVDPSTVSTIDIEPMNIKVSYVKGLPGFDFNVKRTASKTQYVEFSATQLVGTKCTDDEGVFASIIKNPSSAEDEATVTQTTKVGSNTYGLSLSGKNCTGDQTLFDKYQTSFKDAFSLLKEL